IYSITNINKGNRWLQTLDSLHNLHISYLLDLGARVNHEALRLTVFDGNTPVVRLVLDKGARIVHSHHLMQ
ncbi:unnamed protein product, partial [Acanthoscelides obtectus]